jgi:hypothetical protein
MPLAVWIGIVVWHLAMIGVGAAGVFEHLTAGIPIAISLVYAIPMTAFFALRRTPALRGFLASVDLRVLMVLHSARWAGFGTLLLAGYKLTSPAWAVSVDFGDVIAANALTYLAIQGYRRGRLRRAHVRFWNWWGLLDFTHALVLVVLFLPSRLGALAGAAPWQNAAVAVTFPFCVIPIAVPLLACTHLVMLERTRGDDDEIVF